MLSKLEPQGCGFSVLGGGFLGLKPSGCPLGGWVFHPNDGEIHQVTSMFFFVFRYCIWMSNMTQPNNEGGHRFLV